MSETKRLRESTRIKPLVEIAKQTVLVGLLSVRSACAAETVRFAVIGDFGVDDANEQAVAALVRTNFAPQFIVTTGDNHYDGPANIDRDIGKYFHEFIGSYRGTYGAGALSNRFFPAIGNHDYASSGGYSNYLHYFTLPGNERYYEFQRGAVQFFVLNSDANEPDGYQATSLQARWLSNSLHAAKAPWKLVLVHDPPYSSSSQAVARMRWPYKEWGASAVLSGSAHHYERLYRNGLTYFVNGAGGASLLGFGSATEGSLVRYGLHHGAMLVTATDSWITFEFHSVANGGSRIDGVTLSARPGMNVQRGTNSIQIRWNTNIPPEFALEETSRPELSNSWAASSASVSISGTQRTVNVLTSASNRFFRLRQP